MEKQIAQIIFAEKQAEFHTVKDSSQWRHWMAQAYTIRRQIGEYREWWKLQRIYWAIGV